jgi:zinc transport system permease protein
MTLGEFFDAWPLFGDAVLAGTIAGVTLGFLGVYVVLRRMVFLSAALSQTAGLGVALAFWASLALGHAEDGHDTVGAPMDALAVSPTVGAVIATSLAVAALIVARRKGGRNSDATLGVLFLAAAGGTVLVGTQIVQEVQDIDSLLFGTAVAVLPHHLTLLAVTGGALVLLHLALWRGFVAVTIDIDGARVRRIPAVALEALLLFGLALAVSAATRVLGAMPAFAFSVLPALAAVKLAPNIPRALWLAAVLGGVCGFGGYLCATLWDLPVGATQTALGVTISVAALGLGRLLSLVRGR